MKNENRIFNAAKGKERKNAIEQGFYDGRFRPKTVKCKKQYDRKKLKQQDRSSDNRSFFFGVNSTKKAL